MRPKVTLWTLAAVAARCLAATDGGGALVIPPSQYFEGNDGPWSTFDIRLGTPEQYMRVLVSTASPQTMVPLKGDGCSEGVFSTVPPDCAVSRGGLFSYNDSSTWSYLGLHGINGDGVGLEANLGYSLRAQFGREKLGLGLNGPSFENQIVAGFATPSPFYLGILGLNGQPPNLTTLGNSSAPALLTRLKDNNKIPSLSWSYTAGARYRLKQVYGQLIFSGYDASRFDPNAASFSMAGDVTRDLVVVLQSVSYTGGSASSTQLLPGGPIDIYIDSTDPHIWLPETACAAFEEAFGLALDEPSGLYLVNDSHHEVLLDSGAQVTFRISDVKEGGEAVAVRLPYAAFDLEAENPLVGGGLGKSRYFPLRRAANATQYTLGRTFLQEAYLSADYERKVFNVSACTWREGAEEDIITIPSREGNMGADGSGGNNDNNKPGLSTGQIAGIAVGSVVAGLLILASIAFCVLRQRRRWIGAGFAVADDSKSKKMREKRGHQDSVLDGPVFNDGTADAASRRQDSAATMGGGGAPWNADDVSGTTGSDLSSASGSRSYGVAGAGRRSSSTGGPWSSTKGMLGQQDSGTTERTTPELAGTEISPDSYLPFGSSAAAAAAAATSTTPLSPVAEHGLGSNTALHELPGTEVSRSKSGKLRVVEDFSISGVPDDGSQDDSGAGRQHRPWFGHGGAAMSSGLVPQLDAVAGGGRERDSDMVSPTTP
ncbi:saccharopepsin [Microdochium nivale]|nr:saccharopepsin [Microdochium nivale]